MNLWQAIRVASEERDFSCLKRVRSYERFAVLNRLVWFALGSCVLGLIILPWQQTAQGNGRVVAYSPDERTQTISASLDARVQKWYVVEGAEVKAGDRLVDLSDVDPEILSRLRFERDALNRRSKAASNAVLTSKINIERQKALLEQGLSAPRSLEQAQLDYNRLLVEEANAHAELSRVEVRLSRQLSQSVTAPVDGTILKISAGQGGQLVKQGESLAVLVPKTASRSVELWMDGNDLPLISQGNEVRLQFEGWPAVQFSGWPSVAVGTFRGRVAFIDAADNGLGKFRILVLPDPQEQWPAPRFLRQGVRAHGWVQLERVTLGFEVWRRFNGFPPALNEFNSPEKDRSVTGGKK